MSIKLNISGIRGEFHQLTPGRAVQFAQAFASYIGGGDVVIGRDARPSGKFLREAVISGLTASGANVVDYGLMPTPVLQWLIKHSNFNGGVSITAGHNTFDWNSLIFLNGEGSYMNALEGVEFFNLYHAGNFVKKGFNDLGKHKQAGAFPQEYFDALKSEGTYRKKLKFVVDCSDGFDAEIIERLADALQVKMIPIFTSSDALMPKDPEPNIANAAILGKFVRETDSDGGFLLNSDASRVLVVDETGQPQSEELTLPIFAMMVLEQQKKEKKPKSNIVTNYSTSLEVDRVAREYGVRVFRTDVGQPYVVQSLKNVKAEIGGEGSGSVVYLPFSQGFDAFVFIKTMIDYLRTRGVYISTVTRQFKTPQIYKETIFLKPNKIYKLLERIGNLYEQKKRLRDGFFIEKDDSWLCIRASATVSMIRIVGEGRHICDEISRVKELAE